MKCDFEDPLICGYVQSKSDKFDWKRNNRGTGSAVTGPSLDHTYKTSNGMITLLLIE